METAAIIALALALIGFAGTAVGLAMRNGTLAARVAQLEANGTSAEKQLQTTAREFADYKIRTDAQLVADAAEAKELRDDLEKCSAPGSQRDRLDSLLGRLAARSASSFGTGPVPAQPAPRAGSTDPERAVPG